MHSGSAQCTTIDFEGFAVGTPITTQYDGVTFSAPPGSCGGMGSVLPVIVAMNPTASGTRALSLETGCPDFSPDYLRIAFEDPQRMVTFTLGEIIGTSDVTFGVRWYSPGGSLLGQMNVDSGPGCTRLVRIGDDNGPQVIGRVEIEQAVGLWEAIDDLSFGFDPTRPEAVIATPAWGECVCGEVLVTGIACDDDGAYGFDMLQYRRVDAEPRVTFKLDAV